MTDDLLVNHFAGTRHAGADLGFKDSTWRVNSNRRIRHSLIPTLFCRKAITPSCRHGIVTPASKEDSEGLLSRRSLKDESLMLDRSSGSCEQRSRGS